jgi:perosamine synthetase
MIPVLKPACGNAEINNVVETLRSGWWGNGPRCLEFEQRLAERYERKHCITVNSATAALHLACVAAGIGPGDEVILPALTFASTALAVEYCGATPVFADVAHSTMTLDWWDAAQRVTERTKAVIPVDYAGHPATNNAVDLGLPIIQDAAHAPLGVGYGDYICLSFHPVKPLASPDGGAILLDDDAQAERLRALRWCGINRDTWTRSGKRYSWDYDIAEVGYKCHWNDIAAAIALAQLERYNDMLHRRLALVRRYDRDLRKLVTTPANNQHHQWHLYVIRVKDGERDRLIDYLAEQGISAGVHYKPLTEYPMWRQNTPTVTAREWRRCVSLPLYSDMTDDEQTRVIEAVGEFYGG